jgi:hypothetical protein
MYGEEPTDHYVTLFGYWIKLVKDGLDDTGSMTSTEMLRLMANPYMPFLSEVDPVRYSSSSCFIR